MKFKSHKISKTGRLEALGTDITMILSSQQLSLFCMILSESSFLFFFLEGVLKQSFRSYTVPAETNNRN